MARVRFTRDYTYTPAQDRRTSTKYRAGYEGTVKRECAEAAKAAGAAEEIDVPPRNPVR